MNLFIIHVTNNELVKDTCVDTIVMCKVSRND